MDFTFLIIIFALAIFLGFELISKVPPTLHTPLMSGSNAISGITMIGALISAGNDDFGLIQFLGYEWGLSTVLGALALVFATINVVSGFLVTDKMHRMFIKKKKK